MKLSVRLLYASLILLSSSCFSPVDTMESGNAAEKITTGPGPEDMVLDTLHGAPRLLVSCTGRREEHRPYGEIEAISLDGSLRRVLPRSDEPEEIVFRPHGICMDGDRLYVISHEKEPGLHPVLIYRVTESQLHFEGRVNHPLLISPNALVTGPDGTIYVVNDSGKRGSMAEKILRLKRAGVIRLEQVSDSTWTGKEVASGLSYPAGINRIGNRLFVGDAIQHKIHTYTITGDTLIAGPAIGGVKGNDNLRVCEGHLLTTGHIRQIRFIRHVNNPEKPSPVVVYRVDPDTGAVCTIFGTDGSAISAGSTAILYRGYLYISQIFEPYLLKVSPAC